MAKSNYIPNKQHLIESLVQGVILTSGQVVIIGTDGDGIVRLVNPAIRKVFGYLEGEVEDKPLSFLIPELEEIQYKHFHLTPHSGELEDFSTEARSHEKVEVHNYPDEYNYMDRFIHGESHGELKEEIKTKKRDGSEIWVEVTIDKSLLEGNHIYSVVISDITTRKEKEQETIQLEQEKARLSEKMLKELEAKHQVLSELSRTQSLILNTTQGVIIGADNNGTVNFVNPSVRKLFGYLEGEVEGKALAFLIPELEIMKYDDFDVVPDSGELELFQSGELSDEEDDSSSSLTEEHNYLERFLFGRSNERNKGEIQTKKKDGTPIWIEMFVNRVHVSEKSIYSIFINDITSRKQREEEAAKFAQKMLQVTREHNRTLEQKVQQRTSAIKALMDNTGQGFFSFGSDYKIHYEYSKACEHFFQKVISDQDVTKLLFGEDAEKVKHIMDFVFRGSSKLEQVVELLPKEITIGRVVLSVEYRLIEENSNLLMDFRIMVILTDITWQKNLTHQLRKDEEHKDLITKVAIHRDEFYMCARRIFKRVDEMSEEFRLPPEEVDIMKLFRWYHSIKGCVSSYGLKIVADHAHSIESLLEKYRKDPENFDSMAIRLLSEETSDLKKLFLDEIENLGDLISLEEIMDDQHKIYKIPEKKIQKIEEALEKEENLANPERIQKYLGNLRKQPIGKVLKKYASDAEMLAADLEKRVRVVVSGEDIEIDFNRFQNLFGALNHMIRNALDHGIEKPEIRSRLNKPKAGTLDISAKEDGKNLILTFSDDGTGIDHSRVRSIALTRGIITRDEASMMTPEEALNLIFAPGFSSKDHVSIISGRGVGMDSINTVINSLKGSIRIHSSIGRGTTFELIIPLS